MVKNFALITTDDPPAFVRLMDAPTNTKAGFAIVPRIIEERPEFDAATETLTPLRTVTLAAVTEGWEIELLPAADVRRLAYLAAINDGYTVPGLGITLALQESDRNAFTGLLTMINEAVSAGLKAETDTVTIADISGVAHSVTIAQLRGVMLGYGNHLSALWGASK
jgi:hypothetical protein